MTASAFPTDLPSIVAKHVSAMSSRPPVTAREDLDFGKVWLVWNFGDGESDNPDDHDRGYASIVEWAGEVQTSNGEATLLRLEWVDQGEATPTEFESRYQTLPGPEVSIDVRLTYRRMISNLPRLFRNLQMGLQKQGVGDDSEEWRLIEVLIVKNELVATCATPSLLVDCQVFSESLDVYVVRVFTQTAQP